MAEAHSAVGFSLEVTHEGVDFNFDWDVLRLVFTSGLRSYRKRFARFLNTIVAGVHPIPIYSVTVFVTILSATYLAGFDFTFGLNRYVSYLIYGTGFLSKLLVSAVSALILWIIFVLLIRYTLKLVLMYKGWMFEVRAKPSELTYATRAWLLAMRLLKGGKPMLFSFQGSLPRLPLPSLDDTKKRYLKTVRPLMNDEEYARMEKLANEFANGIGRKLQKYLVFKSWWATNYVSDWWEEYVYLRGRSPLMVNSNFYGIDAILIHPTNLQAARAALVVHRALLFRRAIERQQLEPIMIQKLVPLCSSQYERLFNTTRIPGVETDILAHWADSSHIVVMHAGRYFLLPLYSNYKLLEPCELEKQIQSILDDKTPPDDGEKYLGALTAGDRTDWAKARSKHFCTGVNRVSLGRVEKAAFVLVLDDEEYNYDANEHSKLDHFGRMMLHGKGYDRWFDKSFNIIVGKNGRVGFNAEHSWADAAIMAHLWEYVLTQEFMDDCYTEAGNTKGVIVNTVPVPIKLRWQLDAECIKTIEHSNQVAQQLLNDVDLCLHVHSRYGKGFMKKCRCSPDAYIQMALQLAYFRDSGKFNLTYEASMTRLFKEGRTETVRPCTEESCAWVRAMDNPSVSMDERIALFRKATEVHQRGYQDAMCGRGIDRHLFCLYVVSKYLEVDSPFLKEVLSEPWRLSTSQTPHGQTSQLDLNKYPKCISAGGGFGPVADDGYGVSYIIAGENVLFFHISSKISCPETNSKKFGVRIEKALADMEIMFGDQTKK